MPVRVNDLAGLTGGIWGDILLDVKFTHKTFGRPIDLTTFKGRINPEFGRHEFMEKLSKLGFLLEDASHPVLFSGRNRIIVVPFPFSEGKTLEVVVKEFGSRFLKKIKTIVLPSRAKKSWWGGVALMTLGIPTPVPVGYLESRGSLFVRESYYLSLLEEDAEEIRHLFHRQDSDELRALLRALARHLGYCHQKGVLHRDLSDGNILVRKGGNGKFTFFMVDTNRICIRKRLGRLRRIKNLARLGIPRLYQRVFLGFYTGPGDLKNSLWLWYRFSKKTYTWRVNIKKSLFFRREIGTEDSA